MRSDLSPLPDRLKRLAVDDRGYPVPWFVAYIDGKPEFRAMDEAKFARAIKERRCWVCGERLGVHLAFPVGPMCGVNRTSSEPPSHLECATWSARNCPFLSRPHMRRREDELTKSCQENVAGFPITRNPGVILIWITRTYRVYKTHAGGSGYLIEMGAPERVQFFCEGRRATRAEVVASVESGLPALEEMAHKDPQPGALAELRRFVDRFAQLYPAEEISA